MGSRGALPKTKAGTIKFKPGIPPAPDWLDDFAKQEYIRAAAELNAADASLQQSDMAVLATYAQAYSDVARITKDIRKEGDTVTGPQGTIANPRFRALAIAQRSLAAACQKLGFSPADRARVPREAASSKAANPFSAFVK